MKETAVTASEFQDGGIGVRSCEVSYGVEQDFCAVRSGIFRSPEGVVVVVIPISLLHAAVALLYLSFEYEYSLESKTGEEQQRINNDFR